MRASQFRSFVDTQHNNGYAIAFLLFAVLSAVLFVFDLLGAWDPAVMRLPLWYAKAIYGGAGASGMVVLGGMLVGWAANRWDLSAQYLRLSLALSIGGLGVHVLAILLLAFSTASGGLSSIWIFPTSMCLALPHMQLFRRLVAEWARFDFRQEQYFLALDLVRAVPR